MTIKPETILSPASRTLLGAVFLLAGVSKLRDRKASLEYMRFKGMTRMTGPMLTAATAVEIGAGLALLLGYRTKLASSALAAYLVPTSALFHDFWKAQGPERQNQMIHFMKNLSIIGGLLDMARHGAGAVSVESWHPARSRDAIEESHESSGHLARAARFGTSG
jgi:putative oxidoreductase